VASKPRIPHYTPKQKLTAKELKVFRSYVSQLKKQGLISGVDARSARPLMLRATGPKGGKKSLAEIINKNHKLLSRPEYLSTKPIRIRDFAGKQTNLAQLFKEIERDPSLAAKIDAKKAKGERWAFKIEGTDSMRVYGNIQVLIDDAFRYEGLKPYGSGDVFVNRRKSKELFGELKLIRWNKTVTEWQAQRHVKKHKPSHAHRQAKNRRTK
jgi:hypothetical protein